MTNGSTGGNGAASAATAGRLALRFFEFFAAFRPGPVTIDARERWRSAVGAGAGIAFTALLSRWLASSDPAAAWLVAPMGASAVLVFAVPASPAQPFAVVGGNTISVLAGVGCLLAIGDPAWAGAAAVALAIGLMFMLRCLHPPGGASALLAVLVHADWRFAAFPVLANSLLMARRLR